MLARIIYIFTFIHLFVSLAFADNCQEIGMYCAVSGHTKYVNGQRVYRDCWQYKYSVDCSRNSKDDCGRIDSDICDFVGDECIQRQYRGGISYCSDLKRKYACRREVKWEEERSRLIDDGTVDNKDLVCSAFCLDGNCDAVKKAKFEKDEDLANAAAMLSSLKDAKNGVVGDVLVNVFKGNSEKCDKKITEYTNCCTKMGGWGKVLGARCSPDALNLAKKRKAKKCVDVGTYCAKKLPLIGCIIKRTSFCCYDSIIAKIINQEAKRQLGIKNGSPESPNCGGLTFEDLEKVDLSKADFKEFYDEIVVPNLNIPDMAADAALSAREAREIASSGDNLPSEKKGYNQKLLEGGL